MSHFQLETPCTSLRGFIPEYVRERYRPTVAILLFCHNRLLLVQPTKDPKRRTWIPPQGGIETETVYSAVCREIGEECGLYPDDYSIPTGALLGQVPNIIPNERKEREVNARDKLILFVVGYLDDERRVTLNGENRRHTFIADQWALWQIMGRQLRDRPGKFFMTLEAVNEAYDRLGIGWACHDVLDQLRRTAA